MARLTLEGWRLLMDGRALGTFGAPYYYNSGFTYYDFAAAPAFAEVAPIFDRVGQTWRDYWRSDEDESDRLFELGEAADRKRAALPLRLESTDGAVTLADAAIYIDTGDAPPTARIKLGKGAYDALRAAGLL